MFGKAISRRFAAVLGTTALTVSLIGVAAAGTGAYFTAAQTGSVNGNLGTVAVNVDGTAINFTGLMPGEAQTKTVTLQNTGTGSEDMYIVFDNANFAWSAVNDLGQYGKFVINGQTYDNLSNRYQALTPGVPGTPNGNGPFGPCGTQQIGANYLPHIIKLGTLTSGQVWAFDVSFEFNACLSSGQGGVLWGAADKDFPTIAPAPLNFKIAAFQPGVKPADPMNGAGVIAPLSLPIPGDIRVPVAGIFQ